MSFPTRRHICSAALLCVFALLAGAGFARAEEKEPAKILFFTKSQRFEHDVIAQKNGQPSFAEKILNDLGLKNNFKITTTKDGGAITAENLAKYDAIMFYTSGDLTAEPSKDKSPPMSKEGKAALIEAVKNGKPFISVHNALKTFDAGKDGEPLDPYVEMLGGIGISHGAQQIGKNTCVDTTFPGFENLKDGLQFVEEWYANKSFAKDIHVILVQQPAGMKEALYARPPYPATWARKFGKGRVFVTGLGHREDVWTNPAFQTLLVGGIQWALGRVDADITPNLEIVTPKYAEYPQSGTAANKSLLTK
jgi:type 1 glutamine amidotransferase